MCACKFEFVNNVNRSGDRSQTDVVRRLRRAGITNIHEIAGHGYLNLTKPTLKLKTHNELVEKLHEKV